MARNGQMTTSNSTPTLSDALDEPGSRDALVRDAEALVSKRVSASRGLAGMAVRDGLTLTVIMLVFPIDAIAEWQAAGH